MSIFHGGHALSRSKSEPDWHLLIRDIRVIRGYSGIRAVANFCYTGIVSNQQDHIDKPEPRWQALLAFLAVGAIYLALPRDLIIGPTWLLPTLIVVLLIPTVISHRAGKRSLNRALGLIINGITTLALIASVGLLVRALPSQKEAPLELLLSGGLLWLTNVLVSRFGIGGSMAAARPCGTNRRNLAAPAFFSRKCRSHTMSAPNLPALIGGRASSITSLSRSPKVRPSARPMRRCWRAGRKCSR